MRKLFLTPVIVFLISCNDYRHPTLEDVLKSNCFWDITGDNQVIGGLNSCYRFLPDGQCYFYYYNFRNRKLTDSVFRYETDDVIVPTTWSTVGDTLLIARGTHYKVLTVAKDSVTVEGYLNDTMVFRKNCHTVLDK
ncbi:hypothetical protein [Flavisolibacter ginsengisoli]|jgi:hypothetical protein|uniref:Lipocalin-like domain-containing protein n=1 Tax=Flavisolibacter ginsengisoli DSM 18119 TaxID=1121884 RepID=A0A1M4W9D3_9BACT|nr:hypothetical protein [Flavisolibacter ginsengisoli]SHE77572.1 hypothetical protein SAMN02745131_01132 [Flavisolibacter ginsengisoli DSM 18119]